MLLDTSGLLCLFHAGEPQHADAVTFFDAARFKLTTNYILAELIALAQARGFSRTQTLDFVADLQNSPEVMVVYVQAPLHQQAFDLLRRRPDKNWSLCDAVSMVLMQQYNIHEALTTDHHFEQAGFVRLLKV